MCYIWLSSPCLPTNLLVLVLLLGKYMVDLLICQYTGIDLLVVLKFDENTLQVYILRFAHRPKQKICLHAWKNRVGREFIFILSLFFSPQHAILDANVKQNSSILSSGVSKSIQMHCTTIICWYLMFYSFFFQILLYAMHGIWSNYKFWPCFL